MQETVTVWLLRCARVYGGIRETVYISTHSCVMSFDCQESGVAMDRLSFGAVAFSYNNSFVLSA